MIALPKPLPVPANVRIFLGRGRAIEGEDPQLFEDLLAEIAAALKPSDMIDLLRVNDIAVLSQELNRSVQYRNSLIRTARLHALQEILALYVHSSANEPKLRKPVHVISQGRVRFRSSVKPFDARKLAAEWFAGDKRAVKQVQKILAKMGFTMEDVTAQAYARMAVELERMDRLDERRRGQREQIIKEHERRRPAQGRQLYPPSDGVVDAEFQDAAPPASNARAIAVRTPT